MLPRGRVQHEHLKLAHERKRDRKDVRSKAPSVVGSEAVTGGLLGRAGFLWQRSDDSHPRCILMQPGAVEGFRGGYLHRLEVLHTRIWLARRASQNTAP